MNAHTSPTSLVPAPILTNTPRPIVTRGVDGRPVADSRDVAAYFGKRHANVLRDVRNLCCSQEFTELNFEFREEVQGHSTGATKTTFCLMTKDGFAFLAMGFSGAKAGAFKERYIETFNAMEAELQAREQPRPAQLPDFTNPVAAARAWADEAEKRMLSDQRAQEEKLAIAD